jgi:hypothetical protein
LGAAYAILEEGVALSTLFNPLAAPVGRLGSCGHWIGANWVWVSGILPVHMIFSISLPILLLGLALPRTNSKSLLSRRGIGRTFAILGLDIFILFILVVLGTHFWMEWPTFRGSFTVILVLVYLAYKVPAIAVRAKSDNPKKNPREMLAVGALFYPTILLTEFFGMDARRPAFIDVALVVIFQILFLFYVLEKIGRYSREPNLIALSFGLILPIAIIGVLAELKLPATLAADLFMSLFFWILHKKYQNKMDLKKTTS